MSNAEVNEKYFEEEKAELRTVIERLGSELAKAQQRLFHDEVEIEKLNEALRKIVGQTDVGECRVIAYEAIKPR